jgi:hypothetical protein
MIQHHDVRFFLINMLCTLYRTLCKREKIVQQETDQTRALMHPAATLVKRICYNQNNDRNDEQNRNLQQGENVI